MKDEVWLQKRNMVAIVVQVVIDFNWISVKHSIRHLRLLIKKGMKTRRTYAGRLRTRSEALLCYIIDCVILHSSTPITHDLPAPYFMPTWCMVDMNIKWDHGCPAIYLSATPEFAHFLANEYYTMQVDSNGRINYVYRDEGDCNGNALIILNYKLQGLEHVIRKYWEHCKFLTSFFITLIGRWLAPLHAIYPSNLTGFHPVGMQGGSSPPQKKKKKKLLSPHHHQILVRWCHHEKKLCTKFKWQVCTISGSSSVLLLFP